MVRTWAVFGGVMACVLADAAPVVADAHLPAVVAIRIADECTRLGDAAFEHSLIEGLAEGDRMALVGVFESATYECLGLSMEVCEGQETGEVCLDDLTTWVRENREGIVAELPDTIEHENPLTVGRYERNLVRAQAAADTADCDHMNEDQRARYCETVSEGVALEAAYDAWRQARREGAVELEGHAPVDLELIR